MPDPEGEVLSSHTLWSGPLFFPFWRLAKGRRLGLGHGDTRVTRVSFDQVSDKAPGTLAGACCFGVSGDEGPFRLQ